MRPWRYRFSARAGATDGGGAGPAETNLAYASIRAPFAGYIAERNLDPGAYVSGATASTSTMSRGILAFMTSKPSALSSRSWRKTCR